MKQSFWQQLRALPRNVQVLTLSSFLTDVSSDMIIHLIPFFLANVLGTKTVIIGLIEGLAETTASLLKIVSGQLSDYWGNRKWLTVAGYSISTIAKPFLSLATSWSGIFAVRLADRFGKGIRTAPRDALLADSLDEDKRGIGFGIHRAGDTAGATLGLAIAWGLIWLMQGHEQTLSLRTFKTAVWVSVIPATLAVFVLLIGIIEPKVKKAAGKKFSFKWRELPAEFRYFLFVVVLFTLGNSSNAFLLLRAQDRGFSILEVMGLLMGYNLVYALLSGPAGKLSDQIGRKKVLVVGWSLYGLVYLGFAFFASRGMIILLFLLYGIYSAFTEGVAKAYVADLVGADVRGSAYGVYHAAVGITALPASLLAGLLWGGVADWSGFGAAAPFWFGGLMAGLAVLLFLVQNRKGGLLG